MDIALSYGLLNVQENLMRFYFGRDIQDMIRNQAQVRGEGYIMYTSAILEYMYVWQVWHFIQVIESLFSFDCILRHWTFSRSLSLTSYMKRTWNSDV